MLQAHQSVLLPRPGFGKTSTRIRQNAPKLLIFFNVIAILKLEIVASYGIVVSSMRKARSPTGLLMARILLRGRNRSHSHAAEYKATNLESFGQLQKKQKAKSTRSSIETTVVQSKSKVGMRYMPYVRGHYTKTSIPFNQKAHGPRSRRRQFKINRKYALHTIYMRSLH